MNRTYKIFAALALMAAPVAAQSNANAPVVTVLERRRGSAPGLVFLAPTSGPGQRGAMIVDDAGDVVMSQTNPIMFERRGPGVAIAPPAGEASRT